MLRNVLEGIRMKNKIFHSGWSVASFVGDRGLRVIVKNINEERKIEVDNLMDEVREIRYGKNLNSRIGFVWDYPPSV